VGTALLRSEYLIFHRRRDVFHCHAIVPHRIISLFIQRLIVDNLSDGVDRCVIRPGAIHSVASKVRQYVCDTSATLQSLGSRAFVTERIRNLLTRTVSQLCCNMRDDSELCFEKENVKMPLWLILLLIILLILFLIIKPIIINYN